MEPETLSEALGSLLASWRHERGLSQDAVASRLRAAGLPWSRNVVAQVERGSRGVFLHEFVLICLGLGVEPKVLLSWPWEVLVGERTLSPPRIVSILRGEELREPDAWPELEERDDLLGDQADESPGRILLQAVSVPPRHEDLLKRLLRKAGAEPFAVRITAAHVASGGLAERRLAHRLGIDPRAVAALGIALWGRSITEERNRQAGGGTAQTRGHVTRRLEAALREAAEAKGFLNSSRNAGVRRARTSKR